MALTFNDSLFQLNNKSAYLFLFIYLFRVLRCFQHCTGHITTGSWKGRGNQYIWFVRVLYCKLPTNGKQPPAFPLEAVPGIEPRPQRWEARVLPLCHRGPLFLFKGNSDYIRCICFMVSCFLYNVSFVLRKHKKMNFWLQQLQKLRSLISPSN